MRTEGVECSGRLWPGLFHHKKKHFLPQQLHYTRDPFIGLGRTWGRNGGALSLDSEDSGSNPDSCMWL